MTSHPCPKCGAVAFTWTFDPDDSPPTTWHCGACHYSASEDEDVEHTCPQCGLVRGCSVLGDSGGAYRWCLNCGVLK